MKETRRSAATAPAPYHHGDLHEALVAEAYDRVRAHGVEAVSLRAVAQAVGVSPSAAYHHFPDKTAILVEVAERGGQELNRRAHEAVQGLEVEDMITGMERLRAVGEAYIRFAVDEPHLFRHTFGPYCGMTSKFSSGNEPLPAEPAGAGSPYGEHPGPDGGPESAYGLLVDTLDRLDELGVLRRRDGVDLLAWAAVHGFAGLVLEGLLPVEASGLLVDVIGSLVVEAAPDVASDPGSAAQRATPATHRST